MKFGKNYEKRGKKFGADISASVTEKVNPGKGMKGAWLVSKDGEELKDDHNAQIREGRNMRAEAECQRELTKKRRDWKQVGRSSKRPAGEEPVPTYKYNIIKDVGDNYRVVPTKHAEMQYLIHPEVGADIINYIESKPTTSESIIEVEPFAPPTYVAISCLEEEVRNLYSKITICYITSIFNIFPFHVIG